jgi:hypothetical protein
VAPPLPELALDPGSARQVSAAAQVPLAPSDSAVQLDDLTGATTVTVSTILHAVQVPLRGLAWEQLQAQVRLKLAATPPANC